MNIYKSLMKIQSLERRSVIFIDGDPDIDDTQFARLVKEQKKLFYRLRKRDPRIRRIKWDGMDCHGVAVHYSPGQDALLFPEDVLIPSEIPGVYARVW